MKLRTIALFFLIISASVCFSQADGEPRKGYIAVGIGPAVPVGQFRNNEPGNQQAGFAETGLTFSALNVGYRFKYIELAGLIMGSAHFLDQSIPDDEAAWVYSGILVGSVIPVDISARLQAGVKVMVGYVATTSPEITVAGVTLGEQSGGGFAFAPGINVRYNAFDRWCAIADIYYLRTKPNLDNYDPTLKVINGSFGIGYRLK